MLTAIRKYISSSSLASSRESLLDTINLKFIIMFEPNLACLDYGNFILFLRPLLHQAMFPPRSHYVLKFRGRSQKLQEVLRTRWKRGEGLIGCRGCGRTLNMLKINMART